jgi:hypothetical protein
MMEPGPRVHLFSRGGINGLSSRLCLAVSPSDVPPSGEAPTVSGICHWRLDAVAKVQDFCFGLMIRQHTTDQSIFVFGLNESGLGNEIARSIKPVGPMAKLVGPMVVDSSLVDSCLELTPRLCRPFKQHLSPLLFHFPRGWPRAQRTNRVAPSKPRPPCKPASAIAYGHVTMKRVVRTNPRRRIGCALPRVITLGINYLGPMIVECVNTLFHTIFIPAKWMLSIKCSFILRVCAIH